MRNNQENPAMRRWTGTEVHLPISYKAFSGSLMGFISALLLAACATQSVERPVAQMTRAESAIQNAINAGARDAAPLELQNAQSQLSRAQQASSDEQYEDALLLAERAEVDAELAEAKARNETVQTTVAELEEGIEALESELERNVN